MNTDNIDFPLAHLVRPNGPVSARWLGSIGDTGMVHVRYWIMDPKTGRNSPVQTTARYCHKHCVLYLASDYPNAYDRWFLMAHHRSCSKEWLDINSVWRDLIYDLLVYTGPSLTAWIGHNSLRPSSI